MYIVDDKPEKPKKIIISVKSGENLNVQMIRDLRGVIAREKAIIGLFITLHEPTKNMKEEALSAGIYTIPNIYNTVPVLQILTIKELLSGIKPNLPTDISSGKYNYKEAKQVTKENIIRNRLF